MKRTNNLIIILALAFFFEPVLAMNSYSQMKNSQKIADFSYRVASKLVQEPLQKSVIGNLTPEEKKKIIDFVILPTLSLIIVVSALHIYLKKNTPTTHVDHMYKPGQVRTRFSDVAGAEEAKEALETIVDYLKNPKKYRELGATLPRGILLTGDSGNGKTLLARALAGEAGCAFFSASGASFVEQYIGVGPMRVRNLFQDARKHAPSIIFIDEIDAVGQKRSTRDSAQEYNNTLNELLVQMDGFDSQKYPIIVVGATNRPDILDPALVREDRLGNYIMVPYPNTNARQAIFKMHMDEKHFDADVDIDMLAQETHAFSGVDIKALVNQTKLRAVRKKHESIRHKDLISTMIKMKLKKNLLQNVEQANDAFKRLMQQHEQQKKEASQQQELVH